MKYHALGRTGLTVSAAGLGCGGPSRLGLGRGGSTNEAVRLIHRALDLGVTVLDTAPAYGTEGVVGEALGGHRETAVVVTKVSPLDRATGRPVDAAGLQHSLDESLRLLRTERVDVLLLHGVGASLYAHCREVLLPALRAARDAGKCRSFGLTEAYESDMEHRMLQSALEDNLWDCIMVGLNAVNPSARDMLLPRARYKDVGVLVMRSARDALRDAMPDEAARRAHNAYKFCAGLPGVHAILVGTSSPAHLEANVAAIAEGAA
ncbi:MAG TPA: aldo/keto reductase [Myxococcota bacterium]|nr:aldo/keto reductase [Myxococcota bacterium]